MQRALVIGVDFGTDSVRAVLVDTSDGTIIAQAVSNYPRWQRGEFCSPRENRFRQHPLDHIEGLEASIKSVLEKGGAGCAKEVKAIAVDTTGSTPCAVNEECVPLALLPGFESNPNAMFILWKDHTAIREAAEINAAARHWGGVDFTKYVGGIYSSEWYWAKMLHVLREDEKVRRAAVSWIEHCDWIPALLTGQKDLKSMYRSRCAAGHKGMWNQEFNGLPAEEFLVAIDPLLKGVRQRLYSHTETAEKKAGTLCQEWAAKLGLSKSVVIAGSAFDAHMGAVGGEIKPFDLVKVIGTSTCDILIAPPAAVGGKLVKGICGQVDGSVIPGMIGFEAGQSAFGDVFAWFRNILMWPIRNFLDDKEQINQIADKMLYQLEEQAAKLEVDSSIISLDWFNGRRTPDANQLLKGAVLGLTLSSTAPRLYRSLLEATAFGARAILDRFIEQGIAVKRVIAMGGVARKSGLAMQILANVMNREILISGSDQAVALGSAMFASVSAGIYATLEEAQAKMGTGFSAVYTPEPKKQDTYESMYQKYKKLGTFVENELGGSQK